ncbi:MAG: DUF4097 family beta strand repeat-containing protein, partial [Acetobacteraceae bacterium]
MLRTMRPARLARLALLASIATSAAAPAARAQTEFRWERALPAGTEVEIHNISGNIVVRPSTNGKVKVVGIRRGGRDQDFLKADVQQTSHGVVVCVLYDARDTSCTDRSSSSHTDRRNGNSGERSHIDFEIAIPTDLIVSARAVSGNVSISGAQGDVSATSVSGDIHLDHLRATSISARSTSGDVDVRVDALSGRGDLSFRTVSGDVTLEMPRQLDADLSMSTVSGSMDSDYPIT